MTPCWTRSFLARQEAGRPSPSSTLTRGLTGTAPTAAMRSIEEDSSYVYRGLDESQLKAATNSYPTHIGTSPRYHR